MAAAQQAEHLRLTPGQAAGRADVAHLHEQLQHHRPGDDGLIGGDGADDALQAIGHAGTRHVADGPRPDRVDQRVDVDIVGSREHDRRTIRRGAADPAHRGDPTAGEL